MEEDLIKQNYDIKKLIEEIEYHSRYYKTDKIAGFDILWIMKYTKCKL